MGIVETRAARGDNPTTMGSLSDAEQIQVLRPLLFAHFRAHIQQLPSLDANALQIIALAQRIHDAELGDIVRLLQQDPAAAAEVLRRANSGIYWRNADLDSLASAIGRLGRREVFNTLTTLATRSLFDPEMRETMRLLPHHWQRVHRHAVISGYGASWLGSELGLGDEENLFLCGMFHDIGKLMALFALAGLILQNKVPFTVSFQASAQLMEQTHVDLGGEMLSHWRMPTYLVEVCHDHHGPVADNQVRANTLHVVRVASHLDTLRENAYVPATLDKELRDSIRALKMDDAQLKLFARYLDALSESVTGLLQKPAPMGAVGGSGSALPRSSV